MAAAFVIALYTFFGAYACMEWAYGSGYDTGYHVADNRAFEAWTAYAGTLQAKIDKWVPARDPVTGRFL